MPYTANDVSEQVRRDLLVDVKDDGTVGERWDDAEFLRYLNRGIQETVNREPYALAINSVPTSTSFTALTSLDDSLPVNDIFFPPLCNYMAGQLLAKDGAVEANLARSQEFMARYYGALK